MMTEKLENSPNERFDITDDTEAEVLHLELGILDKFTKKPSAHETTQAVVYNEHRTHHILAVLYLGHSHHGQRLRDICFARNQLSAEQFHTFSDKFLKSNPSSLLGHLTRHCIRWVRERTEPLSRSTKMMSKEEQAATGVSKLSNSERAALEDV